MTRGQIAVCLVLITVLGAVAVAQRRPGDEGVRGPRVIVPEGSLGGGVVQRIELWRDGRDGEGGTLERASEGWILSSRDGAPADGDAVERLIEALDGLVGEVRAEEEALLPEFQLAGDGVMHVVCYGGDGRELLHLLVGERGPGVQRSFVRLAGDDRAWLAHAGIHAVLGIHGHGDRPLDADHFLRRELLSLEGDDVLAMAVDGALGSWSVERAEDGEGWVWADGRAGDPPDQRAAIGRAHSFARLRADGLVGRMERADAGLDAPAGRIAVRTAAGERVVLIGDPVPAGPDDERSREERYVAVDGDDLVWRVRDAVVTALFRGLQ